MTTTKFADQLGFPEAPVVLPDGGFLFVEMNPDQAAGSSGSARMASPATVAGEDRPAQRPCAGPRRQRLGGRNGDARAAGMSLDGKYEVIASAM